MSPLEELQIAADQLPVAIWMGRVPTGEVAYVNDACRAMLGFDDPPEAGRGAFVEPYGVHRRDGSKYPEAEMPFERCLAARATVVIDDIVVHRRDGRKVYLRVFVKPIFDDAGEMTHVLEAFTDITREVEAEAARAEGERKLARAQRLESIGQLVAGIAHDFNNLLTVTKLVVSRLRAEETDREKAEALADVDAVTESAIGLVRNLLGFAGRVGQVLAPVELGEVVAALVDLAERTFDRRVAIRAEIAGDTWVKADRAQLEQVVMNLLFNARDAIEGTGKIVVRVTEDAPRGVVLSVSDTGCGIAPAIRDRIFEPYFTTKTLGPIKGTGLGLSTVHGIVRTHGGVVDVEDNAPRGTVMRITLPRIDPPAASPEPARRAPARGDGALVLLVDDERLVRDACGVALERLGFRVIDAEHGEGALAELTRHGDEVAAVVVDLLMPGMPTPDLIRAIKERLPQVPILVATGSVLDEAARALLEGQVQGWLMKPFGEADLAAAFERLGVSAR